jgi:fructose-1,6-bisphosphatase/inositol monophosphatase family enzyme
VRDAQRFANLLANHARRIVLAKVRHRRSIRRKADRSLVTDIDLAVERRLRRLITRRFPGHGVLGEEFPAHQPEAEYQWVLDPIDGTLSLSHQLPFFGSIIGLHRRGRPLVGVIDLPLLDARYHAARGLGAWRNRQRLRLRDVPPSAFGDEIVCASGRAYFAEFGCAGAFDRLLRSHPHVQGYGDCLGHALAAEGSVGAIVDFGVKRWDIAATPLLVEEAGGRFVIVGRRGRGTSTTYGIIAGKPNLVKWLERMFRKQ